MISIVDNFLNRITMYRLVLYYLVVLVIAAVIFSFFGILPYNPANLVFSTVFILLVCWITNTLFAKVFTAATNTESVYITGLILALIISPIASNDYTGLGFIVFASAWAMGSKYIFAIGKKHIFNPAALGVALAALTINQSATWWVAGNYPLLPFVLVGGILIVRKLRRFDLVLAFTAVSFATIAFTSGSSDYVTPIIQTLQHSSFFFLALVMLTEPLTMPPDLPRRLVYGAIVGFLFAPNIHIGTFYFTPELALLVGNLFSYVVSPKGRFMLTLTERNKIGNGIYEFVFTSDRPFPFRAGQYLEWTLPHRFPDNRGNRRYFTIASSPTERTVRLGVKFYESMSSFKRSLVAMKQNDTLSASHLAGEFTLPSNQKKKLVFIAGGIGVTPFRSMVQYMIDTKDVRPAVLLYSNKSEAEISYKDVFDRAGRELDMKVVYAVSGEQGQTPGIYYGSFNSKLIAKEIPDYKDCAFYISGPRGMVEAFKNTLREMGVSRFKIKTDFFPGFA